MHSATSCQQHGFTLIEVAIVLVIMGFILGGLFAPLSTQYENSRRSESNETLKQIVDALYGYALVNGRLPCPDSNGNGQENLSGNNCAALGGSLPWTTLANGQNDAWGQNFGYRIAADFADTVDGTGCGTITPGVSFELCSTGNITILDQSGGNLVAQNIPAVIFSTGKNWASSTSADEIENTDGDAVFVSKIYSNVAGAEFDDLIVWIAPTILKTRMVDAGRLP